jgi:hypothetical protein
MAYTNVNVFREKLVRLHSKNINNAKSEVSFKQLIRDLQPDMSCIFHLSLVPVNFMTYF